VLLRLKIIPLRDHSIKALKLPIFEMFFSEFNPAELGDQDKDIVSPYNLSSVSFNVSMENVVKNPGCAPAITDFVALVLVLFIKSVIGHLL